MANVNWHGARIAETICGFAKGEICSLISWELGWTIPQKETMKDGEGTCLQYPSCKGNDTLGFHSEKEGVLPCGHRDRLFGHDRKVTQALRQYGPMESTKSKKSDLQETGRRKPYLCLPPNIIYCSK